MLVFRIGLKGVVGTRDKIKREEGLLVADRKEASRFRGEQSLPAQIEFQNAIGITMQKSDVERFNKPFFQAATRTTPVSTENQLSRQFSIEAWRQYLVNKRIQSRLVSCQLFLPGTEFLLNQLQYK